MVRVKLFDPDNHITLPWRWDIHSMSSEPLCSTYQATELLDMRGSSRLQDTSGVYRRGSERPGGLYSRGAGICLEHNPPYSQTYTLCEAMLVAILKYKNIRLEVLRNVATAQRVIECHLTYIYIYLYVYIYVCPPPTSSLKRCPHVFTP